MNANGTVVQIDPRNGKREASHADSGLIARDRGQAEVFGVVEREVCDGIGDTVDVVQGANLVLPDHGTSRGDLQAGGCEGVVRGQDQGPIHATGIGLTAPVVDVGGLVEVPGV